jgi:hypothetical protein
VFLFIASLNNELFSPRFIGRASIILFLRVGTVRGIHQQGV